MSEPISQKTARYFYKGIAFKGNHGNVEVRCDANGSGWSLELYGHLIAFRSFKGELTLRDAGYRTVTTKRYLNALAFEYPSLFQGIAQQKGQWFIFLPGGRKHRWNGTYTFAAKD